MKRLMMILMAAALIALPTMAQNFGSRVAVDKDRQAIQSYTTTQPFRSTSTMQGSGSVYSATPVLDADGSANTQSESASAGRPHGGIRKADAFTPPTPIGDAVWPLMLMALAYMGWSFFRRRRAE